MKRLSKGLVCIGICMGFFMLFTGCNKEKKKDGDDGMKQETVTISDKEANENIFSLRQIRECAETGVPMTAEQELTVRQNAELLAKARKEDVREELLLLLMSEHPEYIKTAYDMGVTKYFLPEFDALAESEIDPKVCEHTIKMLQSVKPTDALRLAGLFHDFARPACAVKGEGGLMTYEGHDKEGAKIAETVMKRLGYEEKLIKNVSKLISYHDYKLTADAKAVSEAAATVGENIFPELLELIKGDILAQLPNPSSKKLAEMEKIMEMSR